VREDAEHVEGARGTHEEDLLTRARWGDSRQKGVVHHRLDQREILQIGEGGHGALELVEAGPHPFVHLFLTQRTVSGAH
jgi:hypothetical protein